jgi:O-antigen/teichoic acid export membrane protein
MNVGSILARNSLYRLLNIATGFFITLFLTRLMSTEGFGILSLLVANASFFNLLSCLGAESGIGFHSATGDIQKGRMFTIIYSVILFQLVLLLITEMTHYYITGHYWLINGNSLLFLVAGIVYLLGITVTDKYIALLNGHYLYSLASKIIFYSNLLSLFLFMLFYFGMEKKNTLFYLQFFILTVFVQAILMVIAFHFSVKEKLHFQRVNKADTKLFFSYSFIVFITNCIQFLAYRVDYWLVNYYQGKSSLGEYALAVKLNQLFWVLPSLAASIVFPMIASKEKQYDKKQLMSLMRMVNTSLLIAAAIAFFIAPSLVPFLFGEQYTESIRPFQYLLPGFFMFGNSITLAAWFAGRNKLYVNLIGSAICFILVLILDLWLIPLLGIKGAAIASSIAYSVSALYNIIKFTGFDISRIINIILMKPADWMTIKDFFKKYPGKI